MATKRFCYSSILAFCRICVTCVSRRAVVRGGTTRRCLNFPEKEKETAYYTETSQGKKFAWRNQSPQGDHANPKLTLSLFRAPCKFLKETKCTYFYLVCRWFYLLIQDIISWLVLDYVASFSISFFVFFFQSKMSSSDQSSSTGSMHQKGTEFLCVSPRLQPVCFVFLRFSSSSGRRLGNSKLFDAMNRFSHRRNEA